MREKNNIFHWLSRIFSILSVLVAALFVIDAFHPGLSFWQQLGEVIIHLIPCFLLLFVMILALKFEMVGGMMFAGIGAFAFLFFISFIFVQDMSFGKGMLLLIGVPLPIFLAGLFFIFSFLIKKRSLM